MPLTRGELDITDEPRVRAKVAEARPGVIVNCAAYNAVDDAVAVLAVNASGRWRGRRASTPPSSTTARSSSSTGPRRRPTARTTRPIRKASTRRRSCWGSGSRSRRGPTCCASRACSAAWTGRAPADAGPGAALTASPTRCSRGARSGPRVGSRHLVRGGDGPGGGAGCGAHYPRHHPGRAEPARPARALLRPVEPQARGGRHRDAALAGRGGALRAGLFAGADSDWAQFYGGVCSRCCINSSRNTTQRTGLTRSRSVPNSYAQAATRSSIFGSRFESTYRRLNSFDLEWPLADDLTHGGCCDAGSPFLGAQERGHLPTVLVESRRTPALDGRGRGESQQDLLDVVADLLCERWKRLLGERPEVPRREIDLRNPVDDLPDESANRQDGDNDHGGVQPIGHPNQLSIGVFHVVNGHGRWSPGRADSFGRVVTRVLAGGCDRAADARRALRGR